MGEYDSPKRKLPYPLQNALVFSRTTEDDDDCESPSSFVWPADSDERVLIPFYLSLNEYNVLASAIDVGSDIAYGADALRVVSLWLRNMRCEVSLCDAIAVCIEDNENVRDAILELIGGYVQNLRMTGSNLEMLKNDAWTTVTAIPTMTSIKENLLADPVFMGDVCESVAECLPNKDDFIDAIRNDLLGDSAFTDAIYAGMPPNGATDNVYPPVPADDDAICNAAAYIVTQIRAMMDGIFDDLATSTPEEILGVFLGVGGWTVEALYGLISAIAPELANKTTIMAAFDAAAHDLQCRLNRNSLDQAAVVQWIGTTYAANPVFASILSTAFQSAYSNGKWALWITIGALKTGADCGDCDEVPNIRLVVRAGYNVLGLEFIENVGANSKYRISKYPDGFNYVSMAIDSVGAEPFYITDIDVIDGANWNTLATGNRMIWSGGSYAADTLPCYYPDVTLLIEGLATGDTIEVIVSHDPCPFWEVFNGWGTITSQTATSITMASIDFLDGSHRIGAHTIDGIKFMLETRSISHLPVTGAGYFNAANVDSPGLPPAGTVLQGWYIGNSVPFTVTITGHVV